jgi:hypothetical protein
VKTGFALSRCMKTGSALLGRVKTGSALSRRVTGFAPLAENSRLCAARAML